ncbi:MAG: Uncharacterised protein [Cryomorphaceae bacterium]|nr:MAG: Uncharacterised protein [Cryomorphaceae bacterium]
MHHTRSEPDHQSNRPEQSEGDEARKCAPVVTAFYGQSHHFADALGITTALPSFVRKRLHGLNPGESFFYNRV